MFATIRRAAALLQHPSVQGAIAIAITGYGLAKLTSIVDEQRGALERTQTAVDDVRADLGRVNAAVENGRQVLRELNRAIVQAAGAVSAGGPVVDVDQLLAHTDEAQAEAFQAEVSSGGIRIDVDELDQAER